MSKTTLLLASPFEEDHALARRMLSDPHWNVRCVWTLPDAWRVLHREDVAVVLTESDFPDGFTWRDLLDEMEQMHKAQPLIVMSRLADNRLWAEVLNRGGYDVLMKPLDVAETLRVLEMAARCAGERRPAAVA